MSETKVKRPWLVNIRLSAEERDRMHKLAEYHGIDVSAMLRMLLRKEEHRIERLNRPAEEKP